MSMILKSKSHYYLLVRNTMESIEKSQHCLVCLSTWLTGFKIEQSADNTSFLSLGPNVNKKNAQSPNAMSMIVGSMLSQRRGRWANIAPTLGEHLLFAGLYFIVSS